jgi:hypothetical protein
MDFMKSNLIETLKAKQMAGGRKEEHEQMQALAGTGQLDFIPQEENRAAALSVSSIRMTAKPTSAAAKTLGEFFGQCGEPYYHSGLNE